MKKTRVYTLINIIGSIYGLTLVLHIILYNFFKIYYEPLAFISFSFLIFLASSFIGLSKDIDLYKNLKGYVIDENEKINWNLNYSIFLICAIIQLYSAFFPKFIGRGIGGDFDYFLIALIPTFAFILRSFLKRITISESFGLIQLRRDRIKTEDLESLVEKVNLSLWFEEDPTLKKDKNLLMELISLNHRNIKLVDEELLNDNDFIIQVVKINPFVILFIPNKFKEDLGVVIEYVKYFPTWGIVLEKINKTYLTNPIISNYLEEQSEDEVKINWAVLSAYLETTMK